jgi:sporulation protein YlmC with PRC-barrel domain
MQLEATMLRKLLISTAATALLAGSAMAQSTTTPMQKSPSAPNSQMQSERKAPSKEAKFISQQGEDHWVFSKFKGTDVLGPKGEHVGDVTDILFDKNGKINGLIVGVGGFLGIGEKNVAIDMGAFEVMPASAGRKGATGASDNDPTSVKLKVAWTKEDLKNAPDFQYYKPPSSTSSSGNAPTTGMGRSPASPSPGR